MDQTYILKLEEHDEKREIEFELEFLKSLTIQQRFEMLEEKNQFIKSFLYKDDNPKTTTIIRR
ncbi:hypothetical protein H8E88_07385 [candidate division KSB1 bacterium]|nr:hypothetical protein [candidate division KSB1 bacterium]